MYEYEGLQDVIFIALYCVAAFAALLACVYLLCRRDNAFMQEKGPESVKTIETPSGPLRLDFGVRSSLRLRRWTAALKAGGLCLALKGVPVKPTDDVDVEKEYQLIPLDSL